MYVDMDEVIMITYYIKAVENINRSDVYIYLTEDHTPIVFEHFAIRSDSYSLKLTVRDIICLESLNNQAIIESPSKLLSTDFICQLLPAGG
jgi:hypothetical protein